MAVSGKNVDQIQFFSTPTLLTCSGRASVTATEPHRIHLTTEQNQSQAVRKQFFFLCEVVASKVWCYIRTTITCKNRHHVICGLERGGDNTLARS